MKTRKVLSILACLFCLTISPEVLIARAETGQVPAVDLGAFVKEIMKLKMAGNRTELAMWFPFEFYVEASRAESGQTRQEVEKRMYEAINFHIDGLKRRGRPIPSGTSSAEVMVLAS